MNAPKRNRKAPEFRIVLAAVLWIAGPSFAHAAGYWTCSGSTWTAVGKPQHPMPLKKCGTELEIPRTQQAYEQAGGRWGPAGLFPKPICRMPTHDAGRTCGDNGKCEGMCLAALTPAQRDQIREKQKLLLLGKCTPHSPVYGCMAIVKEGFVSGLMCRD